MWPFFFQGRHPSGRLLEKPAPAKASVIVSITCAGDPCQKYLWGTSGAQVIDRKEGHPSQTYL